MLRHRVDEGEQILLHNKMPFRAIQLNLRLYRFERALELSRQNSCHLETVLPSTRINSFHMDCFNSSLLKLLCRF